MDFQKRNIQMRYKEILKSKEENSNKPFLIFILLMLMIFLLIQNNSVKESLFPDKHINYTSYPEEETINFETLQAYDSIDKSLKEKLPYYIQLSVKNKSEINHLSIETSLETDSQTIRKYTNEIVQIIHQIKNDNVFLTEQPIDIVILSNSKDELFHVLIK